jgi:hypothetical protein
MALIERTDHPLERLTPTRLLYGATSGVFLVGFGSMAWYFVHAVFAAGSLTHLGEHAWLSFGTAVGNLYLARRAWRGEWIQNDVILDDDVGDPENPEHLADDFGPVIAFYDPGENDPQNDPQNDAAEAAGDDTDDKKPDEGSST